MKKERFEMFSDGVVAIIITLMILEIRLPSLNWQYAEIFAEQLAVYALSFITIAITWLNHNKMFLATEKITSPIIWANFFLLFFMSLMPLATQNPGENFYKPKSHMLYGAILAGVSFAYTLLQLNINKPAINIRDKKYINIMNWLTTILYGLSIPLSMISIYFSTLIFLIIPVIYFLSSGKPVKLESRHDV
jgi:uncharacterized membrane protein